MTAQQNPNPDPTPQPAADPSLVAATGVPASQPDMEPVPTPAPPTPAPTPEPVVEAAPEMTPAPVAPVDNNPPRANAGGSGMRAVEDSGSTSSLFLYGFLITGGVLVFSFYGVLLWALWTGNASNPLFETLGIEAIGLKSLLLNMTNIIFGVLALVLFLSSLIYIFRWALSKPTDTDRGYLLTRFVVFLTLFLSSIGAWFFLYYVIDQVSGGRATAVDNSLIKTDPENVIGLSSPVTINFDIGTRMFERISEQMVRQINWDFDGDGVYDASGPNVTYRFVDRGLNNGRFPVVAEVFYFSPAEGQEVSFKSEKEVIITNENVSAKLVALPDNGPFPLEVEFNAGESADPDGDVILYEFDLNGDGDYEIRQESPIIRETFNKVGEYRVKMRVTGQNSDTAVAEKVITVTTPESDLKAVITTADPLEGYAPLKIVFDGSQSFVKEGVITQYEWFVEDEDEPVLNRRIQRVFREPGEYLITLTVQNDLGERQRTEKTVRVLQDDVNAKVEVRTTPETPKNGILTGTVPFTVAFDAGPSRIKEPLEWQWDFENDGIVDDYGEAVQYIFRKAGTYEVELTIVDSDETEHSKIIPIQVERTGVSAVIAADPFAGPAPLKVRFDGSASSTDDGEIVNYIWEFPGREPINYGAQIEYEFERVGNYVVTMSVLTSKGQTASDQIIVSARAPIVTADFKIVPSSGSAPLTIEVTPEISKGIIKEYAWDWGDGSAAEIVYSPKTMTHVYRTAGEYNLVLRLTDQNGIVSEKTMVLQVK